MDELNNLPLNAASPELPEEPSPWAMLFTMLLLVATFLFSSVSMLARVYDTVFIEGNRNIDLENISMAFRNMASGLRDSTTGNGGSSESAIETLRSLATEPLDGNVRWPRLVVNGFGTSSDGAKGAIINGTLVLPGEYVGRVKLVEIRSQDIVVEYNGEQRTFRVDFGN